MHFYTTKGVGEVLIIDDIRNLCKDESIAMTKHAKTRLTERKITIEDIKMPSKQAR